jgi:hypothetical protein
MTIQSFKASALEAAIRVLYVVNGAVSKLTHVTSEAAKALDVKTTDAMIRVEANAEGAAWNARDEAYEEALAAAEAAIDKACDKRDAVMRALFAAANAVEIAESDYKDALADLRFHRGQFPLYDEEGEEDFSENDLFFLGLIADPLSIFQDTEADVHPMDLEIQGTVTGRLSSFDKFNGPEGN